MTSKQNNKDYIVGMYVRLSRDDERTGESLSIEITIYMWTTAFRERHSTVPA